MGGASHDDDDEVRVCVVCGTLCVVGKERKSGFKCKKCVGSGSSRPLRFLACKAVEYREIFRRLGFAHDQPVQWELGGTVAHGTVVCEPGEGHWTSPTSECVQIQTDKGQVDLEPRDLYPLVSPVVIFKDGRRGAFRIELAAGDGFVVYSCSVKGKSEHRTQVRKVSWDNGTLLFPELEITKAKVWLPAGDGWRAPRCLAWHIRQVCTAAGIEHDLPVTPPQPQFDHITPS